MFVHVCDGYEPMIMVRTYLWPIIWIKPFVFSCRKMSGITSARFSTHSKQCVFKMPCIFGRRKKTKLTNLKIETFWGQFKGNSQTMKSNTMIYNIIHITVKKAELQTHWSINGGKCFDTLFKQMMNLSSMSFFFRLFILLAAWLSSSWWHWEKKRIMKTDLNFI